MLRKILNSVYLWVFGGLLTALALASSVFELEDRYNRLIALLIVVPACVVRGRRGYPAAQPERLVGEEGQVTHNHGTGRGWLP